MEDPGFEKVPPSIPKIVGHRDILALIIPSVQLGAAVGDKRIAHPTQAQSKNEEKEIEKAEAIEKKGQMLMAPLRKSRLF